MACIIEGYNYDIFISYRQKDNNHNGWVTAFVRNLKDELESTIKEEISVYFDTNPHDGLLETYDVHASLSEKLKCLIFIPVISRTYCDPKSFAWEHELKAFVDLASHDQFGLKVRLQNGNVTSRVLPVQIHDIKDEDRNQITRELGGLLRPIEFIYSEPGVNRPLTSKDSDIRNINRTNYRNQINKVANAIDEIITALRKEAASNKLVQEFDIYESVKPDINNTDRVHSEEKKNHFDFRRYAITALVMLLSIGAFVIVSRLFKKQTSEGTTTVSILPYKNMSNDENLDIWEKGIQDELISKVSETAENYRIIPSDLINPELQRNLNESGSNTSRSGRKLHTDLSVSGTITRFGSVMRINTLLTDNRSGKILQSFIQEGSTDTGLFELLDPLSQKVKDYLIIRSLKDEVYIDPERMGYSNNAKAYKYFTYGQKAFGNGSFTEAIKLLKKAVELDSNLTYAAIHIGWAYANMHIYDSARIWCDKIWRKRETLSLNQQVYLDYVHSYFYGKYPSEYLEIQKQLLSMDEQWPHVHYDIGNTYFYMHRYKEAAVEYEKALKMYSLKGLKPWWGNNYNQLGLCYCRTGQYRKAMRILKMGREDFPDFHKILLTMSQLSFLRGKNNAGEKYFSEWKDKADLDDKLIPLYRGENYSEAGLYNKAEKVIRNAMQLNPRDTTMQVNCIYLLTTKTDAIVDDLSLIEKIPENWYLLYIEGCTLFKKKDFIEAYNILQKSWDLRLKEATYDADAYFGLMEAKDSLRAHLWKSGK
jgi:tetratricopeptide (TPR) repeat protein